MTDITMDTLVGLFSEERYVEAEQLARQLTECHPEDGVGWKALGAALKLQGHSMKSLVPMQKAVVLLPEDVEAYSNLAVTLKDLKRLDEAEACCRQALVIDTDYAEAHNNLGVILMELGRFEEATACCRQALLIKPHYADAHNNLGAILWKLGCLEEAELSCLRALEIMPECPSIHNNLGGIYKDLMRFNNAKACYCRALELDPDYAEAHNNLGVIMNDVGDFDVAEASYRRALAIRSDYIEAHSNLLFTLNYSTLHHISYYLEEACRYGQIVAGMADRFTVWQCASKPTRLRVGLVSGDLRNHPVGYFLESLLGQITPSRIELIAYATNSKADVLTTRIKPYFSAWKTLAGLNDKAAASLIHGDGIHVLLDLSGHTVHNRLPVFAWKPAPVQASWLGYFASTGVQEIDYLLADKTGIPESQQGQFTETIWYLPDTRLCFRAPRPEVPLSDLPALQKGSITFGCFQNLAKIGDNVLERWGEIFSAIPGAHLRLQCKQLNDPAVRERLVHRLMQHGIHKDRVFLRGPVARDAYLAAYAEVDMVLDTFPFPGGTTTCEALWMGVPTLTLSGNSMISRQGCSLLMAAGLASWIADSEDDYVSKAVRLAGDLPQLASLRENLRNQMLASPLCDAPRFARHFEDALWEMWVQFCITAERSPHAEH